jgi:HSP20 family protein
VARIFLEAREFGDEARRLLERLETAHRIAGAAAECSPALDVIETAATVEILMDLPGVPSEAIEVVLSRGTLVIAGSKLPPTCENREAAFHLAERGFGRFARVVRLSGAFDAGHARGSLVDGELRIVLPRIAERRGRDIRVEVQAR